MKCSELRADIERLRQELSTLETGLEKANETGRRDREFRKAMKSRLGDEVLEKYLDDFVEKNPEVAGLSGLVLERIEVKNANGKPAGVQAIAATNDGHVLVGGDDGTLYSGRYNDQGKLVLDDKLTGIKNANGYPAHIYAITTTGDGHVLVGGNWGTLYSGRYNDQGKLVLDDDLTGIKNTNGKPAGVQAIAATNDGHVLVGGDDGTLYSGRYNDQGKLVLDDDLISIKEGAHGRPADIRAITATGNGHVLIGGDWGTLYIGRYDDQDKLVLDKWTCIEHDYYYPAYEDEDENEDEKFSYIRSVETTDDGHVLVNLRERVLCDCAWKGSLEELKKHLSDIVKKGRSNE